MDIFVVASNEYGVVVSISLEAKTIFARSSAHTPVLLRALMLQWDFPVAHAPRRPTFFFSSPSSTNPVLDDLDLLR